MEFGEGAGHVGDGVLLVSVRLVANGVIHEAELALLLHLCITPHHSLRPALKQRGDRQEADTVSSSHINFQQTKATRPSSGARLCCEGRFVEGVCVVFTVMGVWQCNLESDGVCV